MKWGGTRDSEGVPASTAIQADAFRTYRAADGSGEREPPRDVALQEVGERFTGPMRCLRGLGEAFTTAMRLCMGLVNVSPRRCRVCMGFGEAPIWAVQSL